MGRHHEVRAAAMARTGRIKSALYARASKETYLAAKQGSADPSENLALRAVLEKYRGKSVPKDVFDRAIKKAQGGVNEIYLPGRYEAFGPGKSLLIVDTLTDNPNRALVEVRTLIVRKGGHLGTVRFNFTETGVLVYKGTNRDAAEEALILGDVDVRKVDQEDNEVVVYVAPGDLSKAKDVLKDLDVKDYEEAEIEMIPNQTVKLATPEYETRFRELIDGLEELEDVQAVFHNVELDR